MRRSLRAVASLPRRVPRTVWVILLLALTALLVLTVAGGIAALGVRRHLEDGREEMNHGRTQLLDGNEREAVAAFGAARDAFERAVEGSEAFALRALGTVPLLGRTPDAVTAIAAAGASTALAGSEVAVALSELPEGLESLAPSNGALSIEPYRRLAQPLARADRLTAGALERVRSSPATLLARPVTDARRDAEALLEDLHGSLRSASLIVGGLPGFLGERGPTRILFAAENPAELRGTGGVLGAYSMLTIEDGRFSFTDFRPVQDLPLPDVAEAPAPSEEFRENYADLRSGNGFWLNANVTADFPLAAEAILLGYEHATGERLDGVMTADPFALEALLDVTGPATIPGLGERVDAGNVVEFTTNEAYARFPDAATRKLVLGAVAQLVVERFLDQADPSVSGLRAVADAMSEGHIHLFSADAGMQEGLEGTGVGGALPEPAGDVVGLIQNNAGGNKVDFWAERELTYRVDLLDDGGADATMQVRLHNDAPTRGFPTYVLGPYRPAYEAGGSAAILTHYCAPGCELQQARLDGKRRTVVTGTEERYGWVQDFFELPAGESATWSSTVSLPDAWEGNSSGGTYRLTLLNQTSIRPTRVRVEIALPGGMALRSGTPSLRQEGDVAVWEGTPGRALELEAVFSPSLPLRWWRNVMRPLSEPVLTF